MIRALAIVALAVAYAALAACSTPHEDSIDRAIGMVIAEEVSR